MDNLSQETEDIEKTEESAPEEIQIEEGLKEEALKEEIPAEESPIEEALTQEIPAEETVIKEQSSDNLQIEDIKFEEVIDIDDIQKQLSKEINSENSEIAQIDEKEISKSEDSSQLESIEGVIKKEILIDPNTKKYVIYIDPENIDFIENLSIKERKSIINKILKEQNENLTKTKRQQEINRFTKHAILVCLTTIICFPLMLILVNKALEITIKNYNQSKQNFMQLYKEEGKIKMQNSTYMPNVKY